MRPGGSSGFLQIQADAGDGAAAAANGTVVGRIAIPIEWSEVPEDAQYWVALKLQGFHGAWSVAKADDVAVHVFGVPPGTCPIGSAKKKGTDANNNNTGTADAAQQQHSTDEWWRSNAGNSGGPVEVFSSLGGLLRVLAMGTSSDSSTSSGGGGGAALPLSTRTHNGSCDAL